MVKTPRTRHRKPGQPVTIEHDSADSQPRQETVEPEVSRAATAPEHRDAAVPSEAWETAASTHSQPIAEPEPNVPAVEAAPGDPGTDRGGPGNGDGVGSPGVIDVSPSEPRAVPITPIEPISDPDALAGPETRRALEADADKADAAATETGTAIPPDDEFQKPEPAPASSGYRFEEPAKPTAPARPAAAEFGRAATPAPPPPARRGMGGLAAGIVGALVALVLFLVLQYSGILNGINGTGGDTAATRADVEALKQQVAAFKSPDTSGLSARLDTLEPAVAALRSDVASLKQGAGASGAPAPDTQALESRLATLERRWPAFREALRAVGDAGAVAALADRVVAAEGQAKAASDDGKALGDRLAALEQAVSQITGRLDSQAAQPKVALAIATAGLKAAVDRGGPFKAELETFAAIAPDAPQIAPLRPYADAGVASQDDLVSGLDQAASAMIDAARPVDENAGFLDRLVNSAGSLVTVRPIGAVEGAGADAVVARMEVALKAGDLDKALAEYDGLPDASKAAGAAFAEKIKARRDVQALVAQATAAAMKA